MATDESGEAKAKGLAAVSQAVLLQIFASIRSLYDRSAPWLMLVRLSLSLPLFLFFFWPAFLV